MADPHLHTSPQLQRRLGLLALTIYGVGNMLGAGIYGLVGRAAGEMGNTLWMAFMASMVAAGLTGLSYACLGSRYPRAAGASFVTLRAYGWPFVAYVIGLVVMASGLTSMATASQVFAEYFQSLTGEVAGWRIALGPSIVGFLLLMAAVNFWGIRQSAWLNAICTVVETGGLLLIIAVGMRYWGSVDYLDATSIKNPSGHLGLSMVMQGAVLTFFAFIGFEDLLNVSEEVKNPRRTFPLAVVMALSLVTLIYLAVSITAVSVVPHDELAQSKGALVEVARRAAPWFPPVMFSAIALFAVANTALLNYIMGSRLAYGMARQGLLPAFLGKVHARRHTPHVAILVLLAIVLMLAMAGDISSLARATSLLLLLSFCVVNGALVVLKLRASEPRGGFEVPLVVPIAGSLVCAGLIINDVYHRLGQFRMIHADEGLLQAMKELTPMLVAMGIVAGIAMMYVILRPRQVTQPQEIDEAEH